MRWLFKFGLISLTFYLGVFVAQPVFGGYTSYKTEPTPHVVQARPTKVPQATPQVKSASSSIYSLVNNARIEAGLVPLGVSSILVTSSSIRACEINKTGIWSHTRPNGTSFATTIEGFAGRLVGEDLARDYSTDTQVFYAWMNSPTHREQIMKPSYRYYGLSRCGSVWALHLAQ